MWSYNIKKDQSNFQRDYAENRDKIADFEKKKNYFQNYRETYVN